MYTNLARILVKYWNIRSGDLPLRLIRKHEINQSFERANWNTFIIRRVITTEIINCGFSPIGFLQIPGNIISVRMKASFSRAPGRRRRSKNLPVTRKAEKHFVGELFSNRASSCLLQCAVTSLNENCMSFASWFLRLCYEKIRLR